MTGIDDDVRRAAPRVTRARNGRWLGGVCAGLPAIGGFGTRGLRVLFCLAALCGGIGVILYAACWLVLPEGHESDADGVRGIVLLAGTAGGLVVLLLLAAAAAVATAFGLGWLVFGVAGLVLAAALTRRGRMPTLPALLTIAALTLPATAVALGPVRLALQSGASVSRAATARDVDHTVYRSGFGTDLIDLRRTRWPGAGIVRMRIDGGLRRTIVALPSDRCVRVRIRYHVHTFVGQLATLLSGRLTPPFRDVVLFGDVYGATTTRDPHGVAASVAERPGPTLAIDFSSLGGSLYVRDYPSDVSPDGEPDWPGFPVRLESRPYLRGDSRRARTMIKRAWRARQRRQLANQRLLARLLPGPCAR